MHGALAFLANNQSQEIRFILSITSPTLFPFCWKIFSFWTRHNNQSTACQTNKIPWRDFFPLEVDFKKHSKKEQSEPGITSTTPNHHPNFPSKRASKKKMVFGFNSNTTHHTSRRPTREHHPSRS
jgi:hypothetical protein